MKDALGNDIVIGNLYGYSRNDGGFSHVTVGRAEYVKNGKVRLTDCRVAHWLYGKPGELSSTRQPPRPISILSYMVFPASQYPVDTQQ